MKWNINTILLIGVIVFLIWDWKCNKDETVIPAISLGDTETVAAPAPIIIEKPTTKEVLRIVYPAINYDSLKKVWTIIPDSLPGDSVNLLAAVFDSLLRKRHYSRVITRDIERGGTLTIKNDIITLGYLDTLTTTYTLDIPETKIKNKLHIYGGLGIIFEDKFNFAGVSAEGYIGRKNLIGLNLMNIDKRGYYSAKYLIRF